MVTEAEARRREREAAYKAWMDSARLLCEALLGNWERRKPTVQAEAERRYGKEGT
jgi:hypothetical protein